MGIEDCKCVEQHIDQGLQISMSAFSSLLLSITSDAQNKYTIVGSSLFREGNFTHLHLDQKQLNILYID